MPIGSSDEILMDISNMEGRNYQELIGIFLKEIELKLWQSQISISISFIMKTL